jgi:hypothetical protein
VKLLAIAATTAACLAVPLAARAQVLNYGTLDAERPQVAHAEIGLDHGIVTSGGYGRVLPLADRLLVLDATLTFPFGKFDLNDYEIRTTAATPLVGNERWKLVGRVSPTLRGTKNDFVRLTGFATDFGLLGGYYAPRGFVAAGLGFDWAISTHVKHSDEYRDRVYEDAQSGWYATPGGEFHADLEGGITFGRVDVTLRLAHVRDVRLKPAMIPVAAGLGVNVHW